LDIPCFDGFDAGTRFPDFRVGGTLRGGCRGLMDTPKTCDRAVFSMDILPAIDNLKQGTGRTPLADFFSSLLEALSDKDLAEGAGRHRRV
jgi:hypothetical protein